MISSSISSLAWRLAAAVAAAVVALGATLSAQGTKPFESVTDITRESLPATPLVYGAYGFVWVALVAYVFLLWRRISRVERELTDVTAKLASRR